MATTPDGTGPAPGPGADQQKTPSIYTTGRGYEEFRRPGRAGASDGLKHHRVLAYAWGIIDDLDDYHHIDHRIECGWLNVEANLRSKEPPENSRRARRREQARRDDPADYCAEDVDEVLA